MTAATLLAVAAYGDGGRHESGKASQSQAVADADGNMHVPDGYRSTYEFLGNWAVADGKGRYPGNKLWGDGWGWSWFDAANPSKTTSTDYRANCLGCHVPARDSDWVYVRGYPSLRK